MFQLPIKLYRFSIRTYRLAYVANFILTMCIVCYRYFQIHPNVLRCSLSCNALFSTPYFAYKSLCISQFQQCLSPPGPPPGLHSFPNPGGGAIVKIFQPGGGDLDVFYHGNWRTITWLISLEKILNLFAKSIVYIRTVRYTDIPKISVLNQYWYIDTRYSTIPIYQNFGYTGIFRYTMLNLPTI